MSVDANMSTDESKKRAAPPRPQFLRAHISGEPSTPSEVTLHYQLQEPSGNDEPLGTILLIHGFPETQYQFRHVVGGLARAGYRVVAPDYRGAGQSSHPSGPGIAFTKSALAADLHTLLQKHLGITAPVHVVGHDIGGLIAHAYATHYPADTASVVWGECPLPGTAAYDAALADPALWHFHFHWQQDVPEALVAGRERVYIQNFYDRESYNAAFPTRHDVDVYEEAYARPGALRCAFDVYRAFHADARENREMLRRHGKCKVPALALNGDHSPVKEVMEGAFEEMYDDWKSETVRNSGHYCAEENPEDFVEKVTGWVGKH